MPSKYRAPSGYIHWGRVIAAARKAEGRWLLIFDNDTTELVDVVNFRKRSALVLASGHLEAEARHTYTNGEGRERADIYIRFREK